MLRHLCDRRTELENLIDELHQKLASYPKEHLCITRNGGYFKWYKSDGHSLTYMPKKEKALAAKLAQKEMDCFLLKEYESELKLIKEFIAKYENLPKRSENLLNDEAFRALLQDSSSMGSDAIRQWTEEEYKRNTRYPEQLQNKCFSGEFVRSKSEVIIANTLLMNHIPYRYECALSLGNKTIYPDFTILHPVTSKIIYWEHFGMMDVPSYCENAFSKLMLYSRHNIIPDINLVTTYETHGCPLDSEIVQQHVLRLLHSR